MEGDTRCSDKDITMTLDYKVGKKGDGKPRPHQIVFELGVVKGKNDEGGNVIILKEPEEASYKLTEDNMNILLKPVG